MRIRIRPASPVIADSDLLRRTSLIGIDRSGRVKMRTLEIIYVVQREKGWCTVEDVHRELEAQLFESERRAVSMRLLRYNRQGLLIRKKMKYRLTEYKLSQRGEKRLMHLWKRFKLLEVPPDWDSMGEIGSINKELAELRMSMYKKILYAQIERIEKNTPLRTPKQIRPIHIKSHLEKPKNVKTG